jgi:hypothetical protein
MSPATRRLGRLAIVTLALLGAAAPLAAAGLPRKGDLLPALALRTPEAPAERAYLGVWQDTFHLTDVACRLLLLEVIGVYCPRCYQQAPLFTNLYRRIEKGPLKGRVKMLGLAAGGTVMEIAYLREQGQYLFPVAADPDFTAHKQLGEPRTPFTLLMDREGRVLHTHMGVVENIDAFYELIQQLAH